jgi:hypothetical protein
VTRRLSCRLVAAPLALSHEHGHALVVLFFSAAWASLSAGDLVVAANPNAVRRTGVDRELAGREPRAADLLTAASTLLLAQRSSRDAGSVSVAAPPVGHRTDGFLQDPDHDQEGKQRHQQHEDSEEHRPADGVHLGVAP